MDELLQAVEATALAVTVRESTWLFPAIEAAHVLALAFVVGSIAIVDLRLLDLASKKRAITELTTEILPWTWGAFGIAAFTGVLMFVSKAPAYFDNFAFRMKFLLLFLAGANMILFHRFTYRGVAAWDCGAPTHFAAKLAGALSLSFWIGIVAFGRWIGFT